MVQIKAIADRVRDFARSRRVMENLPEATAAIVTAMVLLAAYLGWRYVDRAEWVRHTLEVQSEIGELRNLIEEGTLAYRNFVLSGDDRFLVRYEAAKASSERQLSAFARLVADSTEQVRAVAELKVGFDAHFERSGAIIERWRAGDAELARNMIVAPDTQLIGDRLRHQLQTLHDTENRLLDRRVAAARRTIVALLLASAIAALSIFAALLTWISVSRRKSRELRDVNRALQDTLAKREEAELQVRQLQKMDAIGQLTGGIAHDFNNMLAVVMSGITLARKAASRQQPADHLLQQAYDGAKRAAVLVQRLLAFSRLAPLAPKPIDPNTFVSNISEMVRRTLGEAYQVETVLGGGLWPTFADPVQLETTVVNLCVNARDAMPDGGRILIETSNCQLDDRYRRAHPDVAPDQYVLIAVTDKGTGMSPEVVARAFDPFFTTKSAGRGTGLGLSQVFGFVKQSGGHVKLYSEIGAGTTVKVYLPRHHTTAGEVTEVQAPPVELRGTETVLLTEDDHAVRSLTADSLRSLGYTVIEAAHPEQALTALRSGKHVDLLLTDVVMPDLNGRMLAEHARALRPGLRVLFMSGFTRNAIVHHGVLDPGVHLIAKPFTLEDLSRKLREALGETREVA